MLWPGRRRHESSASSSACSAGFLAARRACPRCASTLSIERACVQEGAPRQRSVLAGSRQASAPGTCQSGASAHAPTAASADLPPRPRRDSAPQVVDSLVGRLLALRLSLCPLAAAPEASPDHAPRPLANQSRNRYACRRHPRMGDEQGAQAQAPDTRPRPPPPRLLISLHEASSTTSFRLRRRPSGPSWAASAPSL